MQNEWSCSSQWEKKIKKEKKNNIKMNVYTQPSQNVPATGYLAAYNTTSAAYFKFTFVGLSIQDEVVSRFCSSP